jgi:hypothetical protein
MFAITYRHQVTRLLHTDLRNLFWHELRLLTIHRLKTRIFRLSGWKTSHYDCCINSCIAYTGIYQQLDSCPLCQTPRVDEKGKATTFYTLPITPQLQSLYSGNGAARKSMNYTAETLNSYQPHQLRDIHDAHVIRSLLDKKVIVNGEQQAYTYFKDRRDVPLGLMTDGFQCFKRVHRGKSSAWPVILLNYGRPPTERMQLQHVIPFAILPGPNQPKDFNSFLLPLRQELDKIAGGIDSYDGENDEIFQLRAFLVVMIGDMQAVKHLSGMKGPGAVCPCRLCSIEGFYSRERKKHYIPLRTPTIGLASSTPRQDYNPSQLPMRSQQQIEAQIESIRTSNTTARREELSKKFGINGDSVMAHTAGFQRMHGFPHEYMHLIFENIIPMLIHLWKGEFRDLDTRNQPYVISKRDWEEIGKLTVESNALIPSYFTRLIPNIHLDQNLFTAEAYAFWFLNIAPALLRQRFREAKYYDHMMLLIKVIKTCIQYEINTIELEELEEDIVIWVQNFEE